MVLEKPQRSVSDASPDLCIDELHLRSFRNHDRLDLTGIGPVTALVGKNAVGKTNVVEAVQMVTELRSFRTRQASQMVEWGASAASVEARLLGGGRDLDVRMDIADGRRSYRLNGKRSTVHSLRGLLPAVAFCPDDLQLVKSLDAQRRDALDDVACQLSKNYAKVRHDYRELLRQKTRALKDGMSAAYLESMNDVLVKVGLQLVRLRAYTVGLFQQRVDEYHADISHSDDRLFLRYEPSWARTDEEALSEKTSEEEYAFDAARDEQAFSHALAARQGEERERRRCLVGPQHDLLRFYLNGRDASKFASQGQQRSIVLAFKLACVDVVRERLGQRPVLLLDDVMSELDAERRGRLMEFVGHAAQAFVTATNLDVIPEPVRKNVDVVSLPLPDGVWQGKGLAL